MVLIFLTRFVTVVNPPPCTVPCELVLGAKSPYKPVLKLSAVDDNVEGGVTGTGFGDVQTSTTNRCAAKLLTGATHVWLYVQIGAVAVPALYTEAPAAGAVIVAESAVKVSAVLGTIAVLLMFTTHQQSWFVVASNIKI